MIRHHPSAELLLSYAAGNLGEGFALLVASHAAMCGECRGRIAHAESIGGALLHAMEPTEISDSALSRLFERIDADRPETCRPRPASGNNEVPAPLRRFVPSSYDDLRWRRLGPGIRDIVLPADEAVGIARSRLLRFAPGRATPSHSHHGQELTLVLKGAYSDGIGRFAAGDFQETDPSVHHQPRAEPGEDCICLVVTDAPLKFDGLVGRILQPIFGI